MIDVKFYPKVRLETSKVSRRVNPLVLHVCVRYALGVLRGDLQRDECKPLFLRKEMGEACLTHFIAMVR